MFRYDRPQKGRYRQFYQYGIEVIGSNEPYVDAEVIALFYTFAKRLGLTDFDVEINSVGNKAVSKKYDQVLREFFEPHKEELCHDCQTRLEKKPRRVLDCKVASCKEIGKDAPVMLDYLDEECSQHFDKVKSCLDEFGVPYTVNPKIVRGLDYYTHTAFEFLNNKLGAQNAIGAGGRYNGLVEQIGGKDIPGIGFAGGLERLLLSMEAEELFCGEETIPTVYMVPMGEKAITASVSIISNLRNKGIAVEYNPQKTSMKAQMKAADKYKAKYAVIIGEDELDKGVVTLKNLHERTQEEVSIELLPSSIR
jgi:histidyl-tRNA synthetase